MVLISFSYSLQKVQTLCCLIFAHVLLFAFSQVESAGASEQNLCNNAESPLSRLNKEPLCRFDDSRGACVESC